MEERQAAKSLKCKRKYKVRSGDKGSHYRSFYVWECHCGAEFEARSDANRKSCGCISTSGTWAHGHEKDGVKTSELRTYAKMIQRCYKEYDKSYANYGGRGIRVCDRWLGIYGFKNFIEDMGMKPSPTHSIDRVDVNGNYTPENCRWATKITQANNTRSNLKLSIVGITKTRAEWIRYFKIKRHTWDHLRMRDGLTNEEILRQLWTDKHGRASGG